MFYQQEWLRGSRSIVHFQWCISTCLEKAFAPAQGLLIKVMACAFVPVVPIQEGHLTFESAYSKHKRTWLSCACWDAHPHCALAAGGCMEWECWLLFIPRQSPGSGGWALLSSALWLPFQRADSTDHFSLRHRILGGVFSVSPPTILARFTALQVLGSMVCWDQRSSGGLRLYIYVGFYYLLLSLVLSKITQTEKLR